MREEKLQNTHPAFRIFSMIVYMKMNILLCLVSTIVLGCSGYKKTEFETWVEKTFSSQCGDSNSCSLNVKNFKPFNWDKMYV